MSLDLVPSPAPPGVLTRMIDNIVAAISPRAAAERLAYRAAEGELRSSLMRGARHTRLDRPAPSRGATANRRNELGRLDRIARGRQLEEDSCLADGLLTRDVDNVIGTGMRPQATTTSTKWNERAEKLFEEWGEEQADVRGMDGFVDLQSLFYRGARRDGSAGWLFNGDGSLRLVEADEIASPPGKIGAKGMVDGVELSPKGKPVAFWVVDETDSAGMNPGHRPGTGRTRIPAEDFVFYPMGRRRAGQTHGAPVFDNTAWLFDALDGHIEAALAAARMAACLALIWERKAKPSGLQRTSADADGQTQKLLKLTPGAILPVALGESMKQINPGQPIQNLPELLRMIGRLLGLPFSLPLELVFLDFSTGNFAQARGVLLQAWHAWRVKQDRFKRRSMKPVWKRKITDFLRAGKLRHRADWHAHTWFAQGWTWIDPAGELDANLLAVDAGMDTLTDILARQGRDFAGLLEVRKRELEQMRKAGIEIVRSPRTRDPIKVDKKPKPGDEKPEGDDEDEPEDQEGADDAPEEMDDA